MGTCIKLVFTKSTNFSRTFEKVGKLRSYENFQASFQWIFLIHKFLDSSGQSALNEFKFCFDEEEKESKQFSQKWKFQWTWQFLIIACLEKVAAENIRKRCSKLFVRNDKSFFLEGMIRIFSDRFTLTTCNGLLKPRGRGFESDNCFILPVS